MKKLIVLLTLVCFLISCSKDVKTNGTSTSDPTAANIDTEAIEKVTSTQNFNKQKLFYALLSAEEKQTIWTNKLALMESDETLTADQKTFVSSVLHSLTRDLFDVNKNSDKKNKYFKYVQNRSIALFGAKLAGNIFANVNAPAKKKSLTNSVESSEYPPGSGDCDCSKESDWCSSGHACVREGCTVKSGCGTFWSYSCNGDCWIE
jgi:hypothetical protein